MQHGCPGDSWACPGGVLELEERHLFANEPDACLLQCGRCCTVVQECPHCLELLEDPRYSSRDAAVDSHEAAEREAAALPQWSPTQEQNKASSAPKAACGPGQNGENRSPAAGPPSAAKRTHAPEGQWVSCSWCGFTAPLVGSRLEGLLGRRPARFHSIRRLMTRWAGRQAYLDSLVARATRIQERGRALSGGEAGVAEANGGDAAGRLARKRLRSPAGEEGTQHAPRKAARRSSMEAGPASPVVASSSGEQSPWRDEQLSKSPRRRGLPLWRISAETDIGVLEQELRRLMHQVQVLQAPPVQREDDHWLAEHARGRPCFTLDHLRRLRAAYEADGEATETTTLVLSKVRMFLEKMAGMNNLRESTAHAGAAWKRLLRTKGVEQSAAARPLVVDPSYERPSPDAVLQSAPFQIPKMESEYRNITANLLFHRYKRLQELMNYNAEPLLSYMSAVNVELKRLYCNLLAISNPEPEHAEEGNEDALAAGAAVACLQDKVELWTLLYKSISRAVGP